MYINPVHQQQNEIPRHSIFMQIQLIFIECACIAILGQKCV